MNQNAAWQISPKKRNTLAQ